MSCVACAQTGTAGPPASTGAGKRRAKSLRPFGEVASGQRHPDLVYERDAEIDRRSPGKFDSPSIGFSDGLVKLKDRPWAKTTLVFFDGKTEAKKVRLTLDKAIKQGKGNRTCISEVSVH